MSKVFANVAFEMCLWYFEMQRFIFQEMWGILHLCEQFLDLCVKFEKEASFENLCKQLKNPCKVKILKSATKSRDFGLTSKWNNKINYL